jgi:hypothetical protein
MFAFGPTLQQMKERQSMHEKVQNQHKQEWQRSQQVNLLHPNAGNLECCLLFVVLVKTV